MALCCSTLLGLHPVVTDALDNAGEAIGDFP